MRRDALAQENGTVLEVNDCPGLHGAGVPETVLVADVGVVGGTWTASRVLDGGQGRCCL